MSRVIVAGTQIKCTSDTDEILPVDVYGTKIVPMDLVLRLTPPAPKYLDEIKANPFVIS